MLTSVIKVDSQNPNTAFLKDAGEIIKKGGLVAFPTETVYGLGGDAVNPDSSKKIYAAKGRPSDNPLIVHIADFAQLESIVSEVPEAARILAKEFWPGPLTMILKKNEVVPYETTGGLDTVAIRMPSHPVALALIRESGCMIAAPSANTSGRPSPTEADHVYEDLNGRIDCILDGGKVAIGLESTIVDLTDSEPVVLRPGFITVEQIKDVLGQASLDPGIIASDSKIAPKAPGMKYRHYAPKGQITIVSGEDEKVRAYMLDAITSAINQGKKVGLITTDSSVEWPAGTEVKMIGDRADEEAIAANLFGILRDFDRSECELIYSEELRTPRIGTAIMNRLLKAAGHNVVNV